MQPNQYSGICCKCSRPVAAGAGFTSRNSRDTGWVVTCGPCYHPTTEPTMTTNGKAPRSLRLELLIKLLKMTTSPVDSEALVAIRKANGLLREFDGSADWETLLLGKVTIMADPFQDLPPPAAPRPFDRAPPVPPTPPKAAPPPPSRTCPRCATQFTSFGRTGRTGAIYCSAHCRGMAEPPKPAPYQMPPKYRRKQPSLSDL